MHSSNRNTLVTAHSARAHRDPEAHAGYLFRKLSRLLRENQSSPDAKAVHQLRTTIRRIQTLAASVGESDSKTYGKFDKLLTEVFERAGKVRDLDVQMEALQTISLPSVEDDKITLRNHLQRQRGKRQRKLAETVEKELKKRLPRRQRRAKALLLRAIHRPNETNSTVNGLRKEVAPFLEKLRTGQFDADTLHELRLELKHVRYVAETAGDPGTKMVVLLKPVQDAIGEWHDWLNLMQTADKVLGPLPGHPLMTILRGKVRGRFQNAVSAVKPLEERLSEMLHISRRPGPVLVRQEVAVAASAG